jgi:hypothetical protein
LVFSRNQLRKRGRTVVTIYKTKQGILICDHGFEAALQYGTHINATAAPLSAATADNTDFGWSTSDTTTVASAQNQCSPPLDAESIAVHLAFRRVACFSLANFIAKSSTPANQHLVRHTSNPSTSGMLPPPKVTSIQNGPTSNPTNRHHLNQVDSIARVYIQPWPLPMYPVEPLYPVEHCIYAACAPITGQVYTDQTAAAA